MTKKTGKPQRDAEQRELDFDPRLASRILAVSASETVAAAESPVNDETMVNTSTAGDQFWSSSAALAGGGYVIVWEDLGADTLRFRRYTADGTPGPEQTMDLASEAGSPIEPVITGLPDGGFVVAWNGGFGSGGFSDDNIRAQRFDSNGNAVGGTFLVNTANDIADRGATIATLSDGGFAIAWTGQGIHVRHFDSSGAAVTAAQTVNNTNDSLMVLPRVVELDAGGSVVVWAGLQEAGAVDPVFIRGRRVDASGVPAGDEFVVNVSALDGANTGGIEATKLEGGGFVVAWWRVTPDQVAHLLARRYDDSAAPIGGEIELYATQPGENWGQSSLSPLPDGGFLAAWINPAESVGGTTILRARAFGADGTPLDDAFTVNQGADPDVVLLEDAVSTLAGGNVVIVWGEGDIVYRRFAIDTNSPANTAPDAVDDGATVDEDDSVVIAVLTNDSDADNNTISITSVGDPANGGVVDNGDGTISYTPDPDFFGEDQFSYTISDGNGGSDTATVTVTVNPVDEPDNTPTAGDDDLTGTPGDDDFMLQQGGDDQVDAGAGDDGFYYGAALDGNDGADGGEGTDTAAVQGNYPNLVLGDLFNIEVLLAVSGSDSQFGDTAGNSYSYDITTNDGNVADGAIFTVQATGLMPDEDLAFDGSAETNGHFRIFAGRGDDDLAGGMGNDGFLFGADGNFTNADRVDGGGGVNSLAFRGNHVGANATMFADASFTGIDVVVLLSGHTNEFGGVIDTNGFDYDLTMADGNVAAGMMIDIHALNLRPNESLAFDGSAESDGAFRILSGAGDDDLTGGAGDDTLHGGLGADTMDGGPGADVHLYRSTAESTAAASDTLVLGASDLIDLSFIDADTGSAGNQAFAFVGAAAFTGTAGELRASDQGGGSWRIEGDVDGDGSADLVILATPAEAITAGDFVP